MRILFDHGTLKGLAGLINGHSVSTAYERGWDRLTNGDLLQAAEQESFDLFLTTDRRLQYQQNLKDRKMSIIVMTESTKWSQVRLHWERITALINSASPGSYAEIMIPFEGSKGQIRLGQ